MHNKQASQINESLVKYLAGLLDADGSLVFKFKEDPNRNGVYFIQLSMNLASSDAIDKHGFVENLPNCTGLGTVSRYGNEKQYITWSIQRRADLEMLLPRLIKHMVIKARHWQWMLEQWRELRRKSVTSEYKESLITKCRESRKSNVGPIRHKNYPTWAWLAGYLDGDGWYRNRRDDRQNYQSMHVGAVSHVNDSSVLEFLRHSFGGNIREHGQSPDVKVWVRNLGVSESSFALEFLSKLSRHSRLKLHKINEMIHIHRQRLSTPAPEGEATV